LVAAVGSFVFVRSSLPDGAAGSRDDLEGSFFQSERSLAGRRSSFSSQTAFGSGTEPSAPPRKASRTTFEARFSIPTACRAGNEALGSENEAWVPVRQAPRSAKEGTPDDRHAHGGENESSQRGKIVWGIEQEAWLAGKASR
jgi:hypothetical protein